MGTRVKVHSGDHTWRMVRSKGVCGLCMEITHKRLPLKMWWECTVVGCKATKKSRHAHVF